MMLQSGLCSNAKKMAEMTISLLAVMILLVGSNKSVYEYSDKSEPEKGSGPTVQWNRFAVMGAKTTALSKGVPPTASSDLTAQKVTATIEQYGDYTKLADELMGMHIEGPNKLLDDVVDQMSYGASLTVDTLVRQAMGAASGATYGYTGTATDWAGMATAQAFCGANIRDFVRALKKNNAPKWDTQYYLGIIGVDQSYDIQGETATGSWVDVMKYLKDGDANITRGEIGKIFGARLVESTNLSTGTSTSQTVTECYFFGKNAMGVVNFFAPDKASKKFQNINLYIKQLGSAGSADPIDQIATVGWKVGMVAKRLDDNRVIVVRGGTTAS